MKTTGAEFKRFYKDPEIWMGEAYHDDVDLKSDGVEVGMDVDYLDLSDNSIIEFTDGVIVYPSGEYITFVGAFKAWAKKQTACTFIVECNIDLQEQVKLAVKKAGGKVSK